MKTSLIKTHQDVGNILIEQVISTSSKHITGLVEVIAAQIHSDCQLQTARSQVFDSEPISLIAKPVVEQGQIKSATAVYLMKFPNDEALTAERPQGYCPRMHVHPKGERNVLFFIGENTHLLIQSLSPIILEGKTVAVLERDTFPGTKRERHHAVLDSGIYLVRLAANTSHNFVALGNNIATISIHPREYEELHELSLSQGRPNNLSSNMQNQTVFLQDKAGTIQECYPHGIPPHQK